jgi:predicted DNA-binding mobile mystery protein A
MIYYYSTHKYPKKRKSNMGTNKKKQAIQRKIVEQKIARLSKLNEPLPPSGWIKAMRGSLGISIRQLALRMGVGHGSISQIEKREPKKKVTLETVERAAEAMDCKFVYAIVPREAGATLEDIIQRRALVAANKILADVGHTMSLEQQATTEKELQAEVRRVANDLIESSDPRIWGDIKIKRKGAM